jgi:hypothetical protein
VDLAELFLVGLSTVLCRSLYGVKQSLRSRVSNVSDVIRLPGMKAIG